MLITRLVSCWVILAGLSVKAQKINGLCTVAPDFEVKEYHFEPILAVNANAVAVIPYAFCSKEDPKVIYNHPRQWWGERPEGIAETIHLAKCKNLKVMVKPHLWVIHEGWAGDLKFSKTSDLKKWQESYRDYIIYFAKIAEREDADILSIGTELKVLSIHNTYWTDLICEVRNHFSGQITYSANWDNYQNIGYWEQLDFIGIDAYFPFSKLQSPTTDEIKEDLNSLKLELEKFSIKLSRPILFTEFGFRSIDHCANGHWIGDYDEANVNLDCQSHAFAGFIDTFWNESWFVGGFVWKWFFDHDKHGGLKDDKFTPQGKPVEGILTKDFAKNR